MQYSQNEANANITYVESRVWWNKSAAANALREYSRGLDLYERMIEGGWRRREINPHN